MEQTAKKKFDINAVLDKSKKTDKKESSVQAMSVDTDTQATAEELALYIKELKNAEAGKATAIDNLLAVILPVRAGMIRQFGYGSSFKIGLSTGKDLIASWKHQYSKIPTEADELLRKEFDADMEFYFIEKMAISVKQEAMTDQHLENMMTGKLTPEDFPNYFEVQRWLVPTERYTHEYVRFSEERKLVCDRVIKQYAPAFKVK